MNFFSPYLMFNGNCEEALNFYKDCLDGKIIYMGRYADSPLEVAEEHKSWIMHGCVEFWAGDIMASDYVQEADYTTEASGSSIHLSLTFKDEEHMNKIFKAIAEGGEITMPIKEQFWGSKFGMITDKFGTKWMFSLYVEMEKD